MTKAFTFTLSFFCVCCFGSPESSIRGIVDAALLNKTSNCVLVYWVSCTFFLVRLCQDLPICMNFLFEFCLCNRFFCVCLQTVWYGNFSISIRKETFGCYSLCCVCFFPLIDFWLFNFSLSFFLGCPFVLLLTRRKKNRYFGASTLLSSLNFTQFLPHLCSRFSSASDSFLIFLEIFGKLTG